MDIVFPLDIENSSIYKRVEKPVLFFDRNCFFLKKASLTVNLREISIVQDVIFTGLVNQIKVTFTF